MAPYENYSVTELRKQLEDVQRLKVLVNEMKKPDNFTYIDIVNLHEHLKELERCLQKQLKEKQNV